MVRQSNADTWTASNITHNLALPGSAQGIKHYSLTMTPCYNAIPKYLAKNSYKNPSDSTPFNLAYNTDMPVFKWREHNPENAKVGQAFMAAQRIGQRSVWDGLVPLDDFKLSQEDLGRDRVLMCDVGGGTGHQCLEFRKYHPEIEGRIVTEDLQAMHNIGANRKELQQNYITLIAHDFMSAQPIHGAKVYYLRNVIHVRIVCYLILQMHSLTFLCLVELARRAQQSHPRPDLQGHGTRLHLDRGRRSYARDRRQLEAVKHGLGHDDHVGRAREDEGALQPYVRRSWTQIARCLGLRQGVWRQLHCCRTGAQQQASEHEWDYQLERWANKRYEQCLEWNDRIAGRTSFSD